MTVNPVNSPVVPGGAGAPLAAAVAQTPGTSPARPGRVLVLGGGFTGQRFGRALADLGVPVSLTRREPPPPAEPALLADNAAPEATAAGLRWLSFDPERGLLPEPAALEGTTHVLVTIPPDGSGRDPVLTHLGERLAALPLAWVGYLSTTGVYGDTGGDWVDETSPVAPGLERSRARLACERAWEQLELPLQVLRLPAIYGPGRTPFADLRQGRARLIHKPGQVFCRIHVDDIVGALLHCLGLPAQERPPTLILADEAPCPSSETLGYAAHLLGCRLPEVQPWSRMEANLSPMARSFWSENRRVSSRLLREGLGYRLRYPTYREGYRACLGLE